MNVEKLREVGQKIGYEDEELNEFIEEQLAYQLEEERLDAEEREAQRLHEERMKQLEAEEREAQRRHEEAQHLHEERMKQLEQKLRDSEAREQPQNQEGIEQSHMEDVMEEIPEQGIWYPPDDDAAEEDSLKIDEDTVVEGSCDDNCEMDPETKAATLVKDKAKGLAKVANEQQSGVEECSGRTDGEFLTSNPDGVNAGVWVNTTASSTQGEWLRAVIHDPWGAREQPQDQEGMGQSNKEVLMQGIGHPLNEDTADKDSCEFGVMASEEKAPLIEDKTQGLEGVPKMEQEPRAEEDSLTEEQALRELGAREQPQNQEESGQSYLKRNEQENGAEEGSSKVEQVLMGLGAMEQPQKQDGSGQSWEKKGMVSLQDRAVVRRPMAIDAKPASNTGAQSKGNPSKGLVQCFWCNRYGHTAVKC